MFLCVFIISQTVSKFDLARFSCVLDCILLIFLRIRVHSTQKKETAERFQTKFPKQIGIFVVNSSSAYGLQTFVVSFVCFIRVIVCEIIHYPRQEKQEQQKKKLHWWKSVLLQKFLVCQFASYFLHCLPMVQTFEVNKSEKSDSSEWDSGEEAERRRKSVFNQRFCGMLY